jgi:chromosome segregation ATPase
MKMLRSLAVALMAVVLINVGAVGALIGWLAMSGRLNKDRIERVVKVFDQTIARDKTQREKEKQQAQKERQQAERAARLERVKDGPLTLQDRLQLTQRADEIANHRLARLQEETTDLRQQIERAKQRIAEQKQALDQKREQFEEFLKQRTQQMQDEDFQQTVQMYENLDAAQTKRMFQNLMEQGKQDQVVRYLAAMQTRTAAGVLQEFETDQEIEQATQLLEQLRNRGVHPLAGQALGEANQT